MSSKASQIKLTDDAVIRSALIERLNAIHSKDARLRIIEELGVAHGAARIDVAVVNGILHGYEIKSDRDTLFRLKEQIRAYNSVFDQITIVVGRKHLFDVINIVPDCWGVILAKMVDEDTLVLASIRDPKNNLKKDGVSVARLLWRQEALGILERAGTADGIRSKSRELIYNRLLNTLGLEALSEVVRQTIFFRQDWRPDAPLLLNGG